MPRIKKTKVYKFSELNERAKEKARDWYRIGALDYEWWDCVYDDAKECLALCGFDIDKIYFSGFSSQGDGACFEGTWRAKDVNETALKAYAPTDTELRRIARELAGIAVQYPDASASVKHRGHYYHEQCTEFAVDLGYTQDEDGNDETQIDDRDVEAAIIETARDAMRWIYRTLEKEYEYRMSDEVVDDEIEANEYEFTEEGERA